jgi:hypothetical protein
MIGTHQSKSTRLSPTRSSLEMVSPRCASCQVSGSSQDGRFRGRARRGLGGSTGRGEVVLPTRGRCLEGPDRLGYGHCLGNLLERDAHHPFGHVGHGARRSAAQGNVAGCKFPQVSEDWTRQGWSIEVVHSHVSRCQQETVGVGGRTRHLLSVVRTLLHLMPVEN